MKIRSLLIILSILSLVFISCDDDLNSIGGSIQPPGDGISVATDTIPLKARTVSMRDSVYARTIEGVLGKYEDELFGTIKSDYLCQFYFPKDAEFSKTFKRIDSVQFAIDYFNYQGDSLAPMGLSIYRVDKPLDRNFYTNVDPRDYCDMTTVMAHEAYTIAGSKLLSSATKQRRITADLGVPFGQAIYDAWKSGEFKEPELFHKFFPGMYVTTTSGSGSLINVKNTSVDIFYTETYTDTLGVVRDTLAFFSLAVTPEVIQLNQIKNTNPSELFVEGTGATYTKTPAGVVTEVVFPISQIMGNMEKDNMTTITSARFSLKGYTEKEDDSDFGLTRPEALLLINKDSVESFFTTRTKPMIRKTEFLAQRVASSNTYSFGNISSLIRTYKDAKVEDVTFLVIPVKLLQTYNETTRQNEISKVYHYMVPSTAVFRNDPENMKLELIYSKF